MKIFLQLYTGDETLLKRIGCWGLQKELTPKDIRIKGFGTNEEEGAHIEVKCERDFILRWLTNLPKEEDVKEELVEVSLVGIINFWELYEIITQIKRLEFTIDGYDANINDGITETEFEMNFLVPVSYFMDQTAETQTQAIVTKESAQTKNEATSTENEMLHELKALVRQSKSELDMLKDIALILEFNLEDTKLLQRAYNNYKALAKAESKQLREALAPLFNGKRLDHTMKELKKLYDQYHPTTAAEYPDSREVTAVEESSETITSVRTLEPSEERLIFDNTKNAEPPHTEEGQEGDGDDTSSEESDDQEEESHT